MKITFEGNSIHDIFDQMEAMLRAMLRQSKSTTNLENVAVAKPAKAQGPGPDVFADMNLPPVETPVVKPLDKPEEKPAKVRSAKQLENDERLRKLAVDKIAAKKAVKRAARETGNVMPAMKQPPPPKSAEGMDPAEVVKLRTKTIEDLQQAYANGHQQEVFELLSRFGNGAKSFRELPADAFVPIREAIDNGALT